MTTYNKSNNPITFDWKFLWLALGLVAFGTIMVVSASVDVSAWANNGDGMVVAQRQLRNVGVSLVALFVFARLIDYRWLRDRRLAIVLLGVSILFVFAVRLFGSGESGGLIRGLYNGAIQPSEMSKAVAVIYMAAWLNSRQDALNTWLDGTLPCAILLGLMGGVIALQPDYSAALSIVMVGTVMYFLSGASLLNVGALGALYLATAWFVVRVFDRGGSRLEAYWGGLWDWSQYGQYSPHMENMVQAFTLGGWTGRGLGNSYMKFVGQLPAPHTDSIFGIVAEEGGVLLCVGLLVAMSLFVWRGTQIAQKAPDSYGAILAAGFTMWIGIEMLINVLVSVGWLPILGNPLPLISYGGSSLLFTMIAVGIVLNVSRQSYLASKEI